MQRYAPREELANAITHGTGFILAIVGTILLMVKAFPTLDLFRPLSVGIYGLSLVALYGASFLYHAVRNERHKRFFRLLDHAAIFLLIAGSYTPFALLLLRDGLGWLIFAIVWLLAVLGIVVTVFFMERMKKFCAFLYLAIGWVAIFVITPISNALPHQGLNWLIIGGVIYTLGVIFYIVKRIPYNHAIWHGFVLAGSLSHFICIHHYVLSSGGF